MTRRAIAVVDIKPSTVNPRRELHGIDELAASFQAVGQLQPICVRPHGEYFELVYGQRRLAAARMADQQFIEAEVLDLDDEAARIAALVENAQREDPHPMDQAEAIEVLERAGATIEETSARLGMDRKEVAASRRLLGLTPASRKLFRAGKLDLGAALIVARIADARVQASVAKKASRDDRYRRGLDLRYSLPVLSDASFGPSDASLEPGPCTTCAKRSGNQTALFADGLEDRELCTDPRCFKQKTREQYKRAKADAKKAGHKVLTAKESKALYPYAGSYTPQGYVHLSQSLDGIYELHTRSKKTVGGWAKQVGVELPVLLAKNLDGGGSLLVSKKALAAAWKKHAPETTKSAAETKFEAEDRKYRERLKRERAKKKREQAARSAVINAALDANAGFSWTSHEKTTDVLLRAVLVDLVIHQDLALIADREDMVAAHEALKKKDKWARPGRVVAAAAPDMKRSEVLYWFARHLLLDAMDSHRDDALPTSLLKVLGVDAEAVAKQVADEAKAKAKATKKKPAKKRATKRKPAKKRKRARKTK